MILRIHHVGMAVPDLDAAVSLYRGCGARVLRRGSFPSEGMEFALLRAGDADLELMQAAGEDSPVGRFLARRGPGVHHVAYLVADVERSVQELAAAGYEIAGEVREGVHGTRAAFVHPRSMGGVLTELVQEG